MVGGGLLVLTYRCRVGGELHPEIFWSGFLTFFFSFSAQVSVAKVILAVFGVAVVVILIAVPTAIFLNSEYWLLSDLHVGINASSVVRRTVNPRKEGTLRTRHYARSVLDRC